MAEVEVQVTRAGWNASRRSLMGAAVVPGTVESGGFCTAIATREGVEVSVGYSAEPDATSTLCSEWELTDPQLVAGTWMVHVEYASSTSRGSSNPVEVVITP